MSSKMAPTRGNLSKVLRVLDLAKKGHDLLERKRQVLMMELMRHMETAKQVRRR